MEPCCGCNATLTKPSTFVAIVNVGTQAAPAWVAKPVCDRCHQDPAHRTTPIKGHYFPRARADEALAAAGKDSIVAQ